MPDPAGRLNLSFKEKDLWLLDALERYCAENDLNQSGFIRTAIKKELAQKLETTPEDLPSFSEDRLPVRSSRKGNRAAA